MSSISWNAQDPPLASSLVQDRGAHYLDFFNCPSTLGEAITRMKHNLDHFRISYSTIIFIILFISLLWNPIAIVIFTISLFFGCLVGYCLSKDPFELLNCNVDCRGFLAVLWVLTLIVLLSTGFWLNVLVSILIGSVLVGIHAVFRIDLYVELQTNQLKVTMFRRGDSSESDGF